MTSLEEKYSVTFTLKRLHSVVGLAALGIFLAEHFFTNSFALQGAEAFNHKVEFLSSLPYLTMIELCGLAAPFAFHAIYGLIIIFEGSVNLNRNNYPRNWAYVMQRVTAIVVLAFLIFHIVSLRFYHKAHAEEMGWFEFLSEEYFTSVWVIGLYVIGVAATFFHLANGLCTFCMTWGLTIGRGSQRLVAVVALGIGLAFFGAAIGSLYGFTRGDVTSPKTAHVTTNPANHTE